MRTCGRLVAMLLAAGSVAAQTDLGQQFQFESKLWPNLHHFLYVLARARNGAPDRNRVAVRNAPLDVEGFDALPADRRKIWEDRKSTRLNSSHLGISYAVFCLKK